MRWVALIAACAIGLLCLPAGLRADNAPAPGATAEPTIGKDHLTVNQWLDRHPKIKAKVLAKFDKNHNGILDGDEIPAFLKWLKERRAARNGDAKGGGGGETKTTPAAITSPP